MCEKSLLINYQLPCYHKLLKVMTLITFGISSLWDSSLLGHITFERLLPVHSGNKRIYQKLVQLCSFLQNIIWKFVKTVLFQFKSTWLIQWWALHVYSVLSEVSRKASQILQSVSTSGCTAMLIWIKVCYSMFLLPDEISMPFLLTCHNINRWSTNDIWHCFLAWAFTFPCCRSRLP